MSNYLQVKDSASISILTKILNKIDGSGSVPTDPDLDSIKNDIIYLKNLIQKHDKQINGIFTDILKINNNIDNLKIAVENLSSNSSDIDSNISQLSEKLAKFITEFNNTHSAINDRFHDLETIVNTLSSEMYLHAGSLCRIKYSDSNKPIVAVVITYLEYSQKNNLIVHYRPLQGNVTNIVLRRLDAIKYNQWYVIDSSINVDNIMFLKY